MNKILNTTKLFVIALITMLIVPFMMINVNANAMDGISLASANSLISEDSNTGTITSGDDIVPSVSMDKAMIHLEGKVYDIVKLLQVVGKPICIVMFIASAIFTLFGALSKGGYIMKGLIGMAICGIAYTCILFSPQIVNFFSTWLIS